MEVDGSTSYAAEATGGVGGGGDGDGVEKKNCTQGDFKSKRKPKTPAQLEILEKAYANDAYLSEALRAELSVKLGLSDRQLQMWFCHRRLKDRKATTEKRVTKDASTGNMAGLFCGASDDLSPGCNVELGYDLSLGPGTSMAGRVETHQQHRVVHRPGTALARIRNEMPSLKRHNKPEKTMSELRAISFVEAQLGERLREDGPILGMEFDPPPPGAFGTPIVATQHKKPVPERYEAPVLENPKAKVIKVTTKLVHEYQFLPERPCIRDDILDRAASSHSLGSSYDLFNSRTLMFPVEFFKLGREELMPQDTFQGQMPGHQGGIPPQLGKQCQQHMLPVPLGVEIVPQRTSFSNSDVDANYGTRPIAGLEAPFTSSESQAIHHDDRIEKKRKSEEARIAREIQAHEKRIRKELEKQDLLQRKREEQMRKEMERLDKERRKEEERLLRERQRDQERYEREQKREMERREKFLQKESIRAEKMKLKEETQREKETAKLKAANERATSRRIGKEPAELMDDDYVELMGLAASSLGLPSVQAHDYENLHNHEALRDKLSDFPPKAVCLKNPFTFQPWIDSEGRVGCLLMVWKFLITFADVLGVWPFTLDEIVQAFHDHDSRLLGEIHIALLKTVIKDIEDVARTPPNVLGTHLNLAAKHGSGHPQIVEGAYAWGFDIQSWKQHLNPMTWPEIMRQFALSAGFGPKLKTKSIEQMHIPDENEGKDASKIISDLRNGAAAANAFARMRRRGLSNFRKSWHRLTPGTVKYAAFHILSLEGANGLTILEVAEKIQKSGLRDLTSSKTPEASISAALSRDTKLFERTAPSTYCVRTPYRKDPTDADALLAAALEKVQVCKNEEADDPEKEDGDRDEDSDCDLPEDIDVDNLGIELKPENEVPISSEANFYCDKMELQPIINGSDEVEPEGIIEAEQCTSDLGDKEVCTVDDTDSGELWVHGLMEGEYSDMSIEERLDALSALICVVNEGNSVRIVLEERLEAANALKKQLWAEAQSGKRRIKEEFVLRTQHSNIGGIRADSAYDAVHGSNGFPLLTHVDQHESFEASDPAEKNVQTIDSCSHEFLLHRQSTDAAEKARSDAKYYVGHRAEDVYVYNSLPLGQDRRRNRYWQFIASPSQYDPGVGKIFVELRDGCWKLVDSVEDFDALVAALDARGIRESHLNLMLRKIEFSFKKALPKNSLCSYFGFQNQENVKREVSEEEYPKSSTCVRNPSWLKYETIKRYQLFEKWMWEECYNCRVLRGLNHEKTTCDRHLGVCDHCYDLYSLKDQHCPFCHQNYSDSLVSFCFRDHINQCKERTKEEAYDMASHKLEFSAPIRIRLLKAQLASLEASVPLEAREYFWSEDSRISWTTKLESASSAEDLLRMLTVLEGTIKREFLKENYESTNELMMIGSDSDNVSPSNTETIMCNLETIAVLPWVPLTTSAIALKLMELDASICYNMLCQDDENSRRDKGSRNIFPNTQRAAKKIKKDSDSKRKSSGGHVGRTTKSSKDKLRSVSSLKGRPPPPRGGCGSRRSSQAAKSKPQQQKLVKRTVEKAGEGSSSNPNNTHKDSLPSKEAETPCHIEARAVCSSSERYDIVETGHANSFGRRSRSRSKPDMMDHDYGTADDSGNEDDDDGDPVGDDKDDEDANEDLNGFKKMAMGNLNKVLKYSSSDYSD